MYCPACGYTQNLPGSDECRNCRLPLTHVDGPVPHDRIERSLMIDPVRVLEPRPPVTVPVEADLGTALACMMERKVGAVLVIDSTGLLVGILTERDFLSRVAGQAGFPTLPIRDFMSRAPETVGPSDTLAFALGKMDAGSYRHLPVVDGGRPVGVISVRDILRYVTQLCQDV